MKAKRENQESITGILYGLLETSYIQAIPDEDDPNAETWDTAKTECFKDAFYIYFANGDTFQVKVTKLRKAKR